MIYRKAPCRPTRLLLRVAAVGASTLVVGCSSSSSAGSVAAPGLVDSGDDVTTTDSGNDVQSMGLVDAGLMVNPEAGEDAPIVGVVPNPEAGDDGSAMGLVDGGTD